MIAATIIVVFLVILQTIIHFENRRLYGTRKQRRELQRKRKHNACLANIRRIEEELWGRND